MRLCLPLIFSSLIFTTAVSALSEPAAVQTFEPLQGEEILTYFKTAIEKRGAIVLKGMDMLHKTTRKLGVIKNFDLGKVEIVENGKKAYFIIVSEDPNGINSLWVADGPGGKAFPVLKANSGFAVSMDGRYVCYQDVEYAVREESHYPRVVLYDLGQQVVVKSYDYTDANFKGTVVKINYVASSGRFRLVFVAENRTMGTADIALPDSLK